MGVDNIKSSMLAIVVGRFDGDKGYRTIHFTDGAKEYRVIDSGEDDLKGTLEWKPGYIRNIALENGEIKWINGSKDRYGIVGKTQAIVIIYRVKNTLGDTVGFVVSDSNGIIKSFNVEQMLKYGKQFGLANGKIVSGVVSSICGEYDEIVVGDGDKKIGSKQTTEGLIYTIRANKTVYIEGFEDKQNTGVDLVIPSEAIVSGTKYKVTGISRDAFANSNITSISGGENLEDIGAEAFIRCNKLVNADLSKTKAKFIPAGLFRECTKLRNVSLNKEIQRIHEYAFYYCKELLSIETFDSCDTIAQKAFAECKSLSSVKTKAKVLGDFAFGKCEKLKDFDFSSLDIIGSQAFRGTGLVDIEIKGNVTRIGGRAFADCIHLKTVKIEDGPVEIGERCFYQAYSKNRDAREFIEKVYVPKSVVEIGDDAFHSVLEVIGYTGTVAESHCLGFGVKFTRIDSIDYDNSTKVRVKSQFIGANPIKMLKLEQEKEYKDYCNPKLDYDSKWEKRLNLEMPPTMLEMLSITKGDEREPHCKFVGAVNYILNTTEFTQLPLNAVLLKLNPAMYVDKTEIYNDGWNRVSIYKYSMKDSLDSGRFILISTGKNLNWLAIMNERVDISSSDKLNTDGYIGVDKHIHTGDIVGFRGGVINGKPAIYEDEDTCKRYNVGKTLFERMIENSINIGLNSKNYIMYIPAEEIAVELHEREEGDGKSVIGVYNFDDMVRYVKGKKLTTFKDNKFFEKANSIGIDEAQRLSKNINTIDKIAKLDIKDLSDKWVNICGTIDNVDVNKLTMDMFNRLADSYWMVEKDSKWLEDVGSKSLNKTAEYSISGKRITEYKSNQIVKFYNPYMSGMKGAYVFVINDGGNTRVYTSVHDMKSLVTKLFNLTYGYNTEDKNELMDKADSFKIFNSKEFYRFFSINTSKNGETLRKYVYGQSLEFVYFDISMHKRTGNMWLTASIYIRKPAEQGMGVERAIIPILPIGNVDRALIVAGNIKADSNKRDEAIGQLMLITYNLMKTNGITLYRIKMNFTREMELVMERLIQVRELIIDGETDIDKYRGKLSDRIIYMIGAK